MIYFELFLGFLYVGCFAFGGAYAAIPLIRDVVLSYGWLTDEALTYMIAVSESTPGPIMINLATYVGSTQAGFWGAVIATVSVALPSFIIILLLMISLKKFLENRYVQAVLSGLKPCIIGIILATGIYMTVNNFVTPMNDNSENMKAVFTAFLLVITMLGSKRILKKHISPITLIIISAFLGIAVYGL